MPRPRQSLIFRRVQHRIYDFQMILGYLGTREGIDIIETALDKGLPWLYQVSSIEPCLEYYHEIPVRTQIRHQLQEPRVSQTIGTPKLVLQNSAGPCPGLFPIG